MRTGCPAWTSGRTGIPTADEEKGNRKYITRERRCESFERSFTLPEDADEQRLEASCRKGVLELVVPKKAKAEPRRIEVKVN